MFSRASCVFEQYVLNGLADSCVLQPHLSHPITQALDLVNSFEMEPTAYDDDGDGLLLDL